MTTQTTAAETCTLAQDRMETRTAAGDHPPRDSQRLFYSPILLTAAEAASATRPTGIVVPVDGIQPAAKGRVEFVFD
jgi:hypothetical protein